MDTILSTLRSGGALSPIGSGGIEVYDGVGSSAGERQLEGSPTGTEDLCDPFDANGPAGGPDGNPGCQEISPMSRAMDSSICEDDNAAANGEGMAVCMDGIVVMARNAAIGQYGENAAACTAYNEANTNNNVAGSPVPSFPDHSVGRMNFSRSIDCNADGDSTDAEDITVGDWKDVLRLLYSGCLPGDGACNTINRIERCDPNFSAAASDRGSKRACLVSNWQNLFQDTTACDSPAGPCQNGVLRALRRDDSSGTTQFFLEVLGVGASLTQRTSLLPLGAGCTTIPTNFSFCDGGESEAIFPQGTTCAPGGDPLKTRCANDEDICTINQNLGVVLAVRTPISGNPTLSFPPNQCARGSFAKRQYLNSSQPVCPDGTSPSAGQCRLPFWNNAGVQDFNCLNRRDSLPPSIPSPTTKDGRAYNLVVRNSAGDVLKNEQTPNYPEMATWRINQAVVRMGIGEQSGAYAASELVCNQNSATDIIGCATAQTYTAPVATAPSCMLGFAGREAAALNPFDDRQEPFRLNDRGPTNTEVLARKPGLPLNLATTYPIARFLYVNAINGFENIEADCLAAGQDPDYCSDELAIAEVFADVTEYLPNTGLVWNACANTGYIPMEYNAANPTATGPACQGTSVTSGCGEPENQGCAVDATDGVNRQCTRAECIPN